MVLTVPEPAAFEPRIREIGREVLAGMADQQAVLFQGDWWLAQTMQWAAKDPEFKTQLLRFLDVFPSLKDADAIAEHMQEYFKHPSGELPVAVRLGLKACAPGLLTTKPAAKAIELNLFAMAEFFIPGKDAATVLPTLRRLRRERGGFTLNVLGEAGLGRADLEAVQQTYLNLLRDLPGQAAAWQPDELLDRAPWGAVPRVRLSVKITSLAPCDPIDFEGSVQTVCERLRPVLRLAVAQGAGVMVDMEQFRYRSVFTAAFRRLMTEHEFRDYPHFGITVQAYLRDAEEDVNDLLSLGRERSTPLAVRLVKGAYWDYEVVIAKQNHWPVPVLTHKIDTDAQFERLTRLLLSHSDALRVTLATHNARSIAHALALLRTIGLPDTTIEFQVLHGMAEPLKHALGKMGLRAAEYVPVGEVLPGLAYLARRALENTATQSFLRQVYMEHANPEELLRAPLPTPDLKEMPLERLEVHPTEPARPGVFTNEPHADFARDINRIDMKAALEAMENNLGEHRPLMIAGRAIDSTEAIISVNPAHPSQVVGTCARAGSAEAEEAVQAARDAFPAWRDTAAGLRAAVLFRAADLMRRDRFRLAALLIIEAGKPWREADAEVAEAIDFLEYYGRRVLELARPSDLADVPGETDLHFYEPRGVAAVIAPWNFPLAILTGMTGAALVTGNTVVMKPASATPMIGFEVYSLLCAAGLPPETLSFLPGAGADVGAYLCAHPDVDLVAFTGSRDVGLGLVREAAVVRPGQRNIKRVIAEMGGKNAIIIDSDADLDAAVEGVAASAFGYAGQKCSACSRAIVLADVYEQFVERLVAAASGLSVGDPALPTTAVGPLIGEDAVAKVRSYIDTGLLEATLVSGGETPQEGFYVGPHVFTAVDPQAVIAQEEIFGPVLSVIQVGDFTQALSVALATPYGLTGGVYSRSPGNIERAGREFRVGNLYINRGITGAMVGRQPFGGSRMSGVGSKAGGPDYLLQFLEPRTVTENTMRRGFAPLDEPSEGIEY